MTTTTKEPLISIPQPQLSHSKHRAQQINPHPIHKIVFLSSQERLKQRQANQCTRKSSCTSTTVQSQRSYDFSSTVRHILLLLTFQLYFYSQNFVLANNSTGIICAYSKIIGNQLLITGHRLKVGKTPTECMQLCCSSYTINLISERTNCKYRESHLAQSTGQGGQVKSHQLPVITTQN